jgi:hypothetical protein
MKALVAAKVRTFGLCIGVLILLGANPSVAQQANSRVDPNADKLLRRMSDFLTQQRSFSLKAEIWQDIQISTGQQIQAGRQIQFQLQRPNRLRIEVQSPRRDRQLLFDGQNITLLDRKHRYYGIIPMSGSLDDAMDKAVEQFGIEMPLADFLTSNPYEDLLTNVLSGSDIGPVTVLGTPCEHLAFTKGNIDWQVWIEKGDRPLPKKFVITYKDEPGTPQFTAIFTNWDLTTEIPDSTFTFEPPHGARKIPVRDMRSVVHPQPQNQQQGAK